MLLELNRVNVIDLCIKEVARVEGDKSKTARSQVQKMMFIANAIMNANPEITFKVEGVRGNSDIRDFDLFNAGSMVECLVKHYRKGYIDTYKSSNDLLPDERDGFMEYEIKASLPNARNTASKEPQTIILVNMKGAYLIRKDQWATVPTDSKGKYYENLDYSEYGVRKLKGLSEKLGL